VAGASSSSALWSNSDLDPEVLSLPASSLPLLLPLSSSFAVPASSVLEVTPVLDAPSPASTTPPEASGTVGQSRKNLNQPTALKRGRNIPPLGSLGARTTLTPKAFKTTMRSLRLRSAAERGMPEPASKDSRLNIIKERWQSRLTWLQTHVMEGVEQRAHRGGVKRGWSLHCKKLQSNTIKRRMSV